MAYRMPPALPKDIVAIATVLLVVVLVSFPASSAQVTVLVLVGGCVYFLLTSRTKQTAAELEMQRAPDMRSTLLARLEAKRAQATHEQKAGQQREKASIQEDVSTAAELPEVEAAKSASKAEASGSTRQAAAAGQPKTVDVAPSSRAIAKEDRAAAAETGNGPSNAPLAGGAAVLARLRQQRAQGNKAAAAAEKEAAAKEVVVAYASQTGTAHEIAKGIQAESASHGIRSKVMSLNELGFEEVGNGRAPLMVIVASSTGDGDPPDNSAKFYATMRRRTQEAGILKGVKFTCLGLGDSNYTRFMGVSRAIRTRMQELGAEPFYRMGEADEVDGLESNVDPWVEGLWAALKAEIGKKEDAVQSLAVQESSATVQKAGSQRVGTDLVGIPALAACRVSLRWLGDATDSAGAQEERHPTESEMERRDPAGVYSPTAPYWATVTAARYLTATSSDRKVLHLEVDLSGSGMQYQPGDSLGISPVNHSALVDGLLERLGVNGGRAFEVLSADSGEKKGLLPHLGSPCTLRAALECGVDLTSVPRKSLLRLLAEHCSDPEEQRTLLHLSSRGGRDEYAALISPASPSLLDLLQRFRSCQPPLDSLLDALQPLAPRLYSVSSSPLQHPDSAHIAFSVVRIGSPPPNVTIPYPGMDAGSRDDAGDSTNRWGVATGWLERQVELLLAGKSKAAVRIPVHLRRGGTFRLPEDLSAPLLMIGPGTGVTPFRGFLQHRRQRLKQENGAAAGPAWLYFGCRGLDEDFLYKEELQEMASDGTLSRLEVALSREGPEKVYVQHRMREQADELYPILSHPDAFVFVCGDGAKMAKDVHSTLVEILEKGGGTSAAEATARLAAMTKAGQYVRDIWS